TGTERVAELEALADDVYRYFGLGCRNVTHLYVPEQYNFVPLLEAFRKYDYLKEHHKYRNNYDYNLALFILNKQFYMCNDSLLLSENESVFSPISVLHYSFYRDVEPVVNALKSMDTVQAVVGYGGLPFGVSQCPAMDVFADGVNTLQFLQSL
ncbi:MAG TPA: acyl-CoA reductase, partial [Chitinophagaceae bacterium]|nr:acyl-CoA reductase [Chitinophagaceae bacterium]